MSVVDGRIEGIDYQVDRQHFVGRLALDEYRVGPRPPVLVCHEGPGLDEHMQGRAVRSLLSAASRSLSTIAAEGNRCPATKRWHDSMS
jgi:hypothetical protein